MALSAHMEYLQQAPTNYNHSGYQHLYMHKKFGNRVILQRSTNVSSGTESPMNQHHPGHTKASRNQLSFVKHKKSQAKELFRPYALTEMNTTHKRQIREDAASYDCEQQQHVAKWTALDPTNVAGYTSITPHTILPSYYGLLNQQQHMAEWTTLDDTNVAGYTSITPHTTLPSYYGMLNQQQHMEKWTALDSTNSAGYTSMTLPSYYGLLNQQQHMAEWTTLDATNVAGYTSITPHTPPLSYYGRVNQYTPAPELSRQTMSVLLQKQLSAFQIRQWLDMNPDPNTWSMECRNVLNKMLN